MSWEAQTVESVDSPVSSGPRGDADSASQPNALRPFNVLLMGAPIGIGNRGVSALGSALVRLISSTRSEARISLLIASRDAKSVKIEVDGRERDLPVVNYRMSPRAKLHEQLWWILLLSLLYRLVPARRFRSLLASSNYWLRSVSEADLVGDIRGGDSFSDIYGLKGFVRGSLPVLSVLWIRKSILLLPQTYGPYKSCISRWIARYILMRASTILTRDVAGVEVVSQLTGGKRKAMFSPDVAFALESKRPNTLGIRPPLEKRPQRVLVGLNVSGLLFNGGYDRNNMFGLKLDYRAFIAELLRQLLKNPEVDILLVPHTFAASGRVESDNEACEKLAETIPSNEAHRVHQVVEAYDQFHIKGVISLCDFFIGSRMHACIAALSQGIPTVGVAYSKKFAGVFGSVGAGDWVVDGRECDDTSALAKTLSVFEKRGLLKRGLSQRVAEAQRSLAKIFHDCLNAADLQSNT